MVWTRCKEAVKAASRGGIWMNSVFRICGHRERKCRMHWAGPLDVGEPKRAWRMFHMETGYVVAAWYSFVVVELEVIACSSSI